MAASDSIRTRSHLDGCLFLVRHLLILKEVIGSLDELRMREEGLASGPSDWSRDGRKISGTSPRPDLSTMRSGLTGGGVTGDFEFSIGFLERVTTNNAAETLANMLNRTTSLLPEGLFASLGVARNPENDMRGVKQEIDHSLRQGCEDAIAACVYPVCGPLESWSTSLGPKAGLGPSAPVAPTPTPASLQGLKDEAPEVNRRFLEAVQRDLRDGIWRVRLYLGDERTAKVLVEHILARISDGYEQWGDSVRLLFKEQLPGDLDIMSSARLDDLLRSTTGEAIA